MRVSRPVVVDALFEDSLGDLRRASIVLELLHDDMIKPYMLLPDPGAGYTSVLLTNDQREALGYAVTLVVEKARQIEEDFYKASLKATREAGP